MVDRWKHRTIPTQHQHSGAVLNISNDVYTLAIFLGILVTLNFDYLSQIIISTGDYYNF